MSENTSQKDEEIDLGQLFTLIGNGFNRIFRFFTDSANWLFNLFITIVLFFRKHFIKFAIAGSIGLAIGIVLDVTKEPVYSASMEVRPNMSSGRSLYKNVGYYNELASQKDSMMLAQIFGISQEQAASLIGFEIEPIVNENQILSTYDDFLLSIDSVTAESFDFKEYKSNFFQYDYKRHIITVESDRDDVFGFLGDSLISIISNNEFYRSQREAEIAVLDRNGEFFMNTLQDVDTLRKKYLEALMLEAKKENSTGTHINMASTEQSSKEVDLFAKEDAISKGLDKIIRDRVRFRDIISVISEFEAVGAEKIHVVERNSFRVAALAILMTFLFLITGEINKFLIAKENLVNNNI